MPEEKKLFILSTKNPTYFPQECHHNVVCSLEAKNEIEALEKMIKLFKDY